MKSILLSFSLCLLLKSVNAQNLHLILASDYADTTFGKKSLQNEDAIEKMYHHVSSKLGYRLKKIYFNNGISNQHFNRTDIVSSLAAITTNSEDIIIFYYSGYATFPENSNSNFPSFKLTDSTLAMDEVAQQLREKMGRLVMVIADIRDTNNKLINFPRPLQKEEDFSKIIAQKIFLEPVGVYKIASAKKNMPSYPYFTMAFTDNYYQALEITDAELIPPTSINFVLKNTQLQLNTMIKQSEVKKPQQIIASFEKVEKPVKSYMPSNFEISSPKELKTQLELLVNSSVEEDIKKAAEIIKNLFIPKAIIEVKTENRNINVQNNEIVKLSIENYIKRTNKYNKTMKRTINFSVSDFKRTDDFKKFSSLKIIEKIK